MQISIGYRRLDEVSKENESIYQKYFLYYYLFPKDHPIEEEELLYFLLQKDGFLEKYKFKTSDAAINYEHSIINYLKQVQLLLMSESQ